MKLSYVCRCRSRQNPAGIPHDHNPIEECPAEPVISEPNYSARPVATVTVSPVAPDTPAPVKEARTWTLEERFDVDSRHTVAVGPSLFIGEHVPVVEQAALLVAIERGDMWRDVAVDNEAKFADKLAAETQRADGLKAWQDRIVQVLIASPAKKNEDAGFSKDRLDALVAPLISNLQKRVAELADERDRLALRVEELMAENELLHIANAAIKESP